MYWMLPNKYYGMFQDEVIGLHYVSLIKVTNVAIQLNYQEPHTFNVLLLGLKFCLGIGLFFGDFHEVLHFPR